LPAARRCQRVALSIFLCFFLRMRLRRFLISDPMTNRRLAALWRRPPSSLAPDREAAARRRWIVGYQLVAVDHVQLAMPRGQEAVARAFYEAVLGLEERPKPPVLAARGGCWFSNDQVTLHLGVEDDFRPARKAHPALVVQDLDDLCAALEAAGHTLRFDDEVPGARRCYVDDPFGNRIELIEV